MKKVLIIFLILAIFISLVACTKTNENEKTDTDEVSCEDGIVSESEVEPKIDSEIESEDNKEPEIRCSEMLPDPKTVFVNGKITVYSDVKDSYSIFVRNYTSEEHDNFIQLSKEKNFKNIYYQDEKVFSAGTEDEIYYLDIYEEEDNEGLYLLISCYY